MRKGPIGGGQQPGVRPGDSAGAALAPTRRPDSNRQKGRRKKRHPTRRQEPPLLVCQCLCACPPIHRAPRALCDPAISAAQPRIPTSRSLNPTRGVQSGDPAAGQTNRGAQPLLVHAGFSFLTDPVPTVSLRTSGVFVSAEYALTVPLRLQGLCTLHPLAWVRPKGPWPSLAGNGKNGVLRPDYGRRS